jgi:hypothetical protein
MPSRSDCWNITNSATATASEAQNQPRGDRPIVNFGIESSSFPAQSVERPLVSVEDEARGTTVRSLC